MARGRRAHEAIAASDAALGALLNAAPVEPMASHVSFLRGLLAKRTTLLVGGSGAPGSRPGVKLIQDLDELEEWGKGIVRGA